MDDANWIVYHVGRIKRNAGANTPHVRVSSSRWTFNSFFDLLSPIERIDRALGLFAFTLFALLGEFGL